MTHKNTSRSVDSLLGIMRTLREPGGCPWDASQTPESLAPYIIEEACELVDAIESNDQALILDELGDLLLQVVFQAQIFAERNTFDFHDVAHGISEKLIRRHPHVFDQKSGSASEHELEYQWEEIKRKETTQIKSCLADHLPRNLPALQRAQKLIKRACKSKRQNELSPPQKNLEAAISAFTDGDNILTEEIVGQLLFLVVKLAHDAGIDAESSLRKTTVNILHKLDRK